jgi:hypothetical protein
MRIWILAVLLPAGLLAQTSPPRAANQDAFRRLPARVDWFQPGTHSPQSGPKMAAVAPGVCSIPLLRVPVPKGAIDRMPLPGLPDASIDPKFVLPAPPVCEAWKK